MILLTIFWNLSGVKSSIETSSFLGLLEVVARPVFTASTCFMYMITICQCSDLSSQLNLHVS